MNYLEYGQLNSWIVAGNANTVSDRTQAFISPVACFIRPPDLFKLNSGWFNAVAVKVDKLSSHTYFLSMFPNLAM